jgi:hypothetical protein
MAEVWSARPDKFRRGACPEAESSLRQVVVCREASKARPERRRWASNFQVGLLEFPAASIRLAERELAHPVDSKPQAYRPQPERNPANRADARGRLQSPRQFESDRWDF